MAGSRNWFEVDKEGLGKALAARGIEFAIGELLQNAWDADGVTRVDVTLVPVEHSPTAILTVEDDSPSGFTDLAHAYRLFGGSTKAKDPTKRGKWDLGEKLVFALAKRATVASTTGTVAFDEKGRHLIRSAKRERGSRVEAVLPMTRKDLERCSAFIAKLIPPAGIKTTFNGAPIAHRTQIQAVRTSLETQIADDDGRLRRMWRDCDVHVHQPRPGEPGTLYEMGLPVQETGDAYHYDVQQRVPTGLDRDAVSAYYLNTVRSAVLNAMTSQVEQPAAEWVDRALETSASLDTVKTIITKRFGEKAVAADPTDAEAGHRATAAGYTVVHGGSLSGEIWERVRQAGALPRAGLIFPTKPKGASPANEIPQSEWTPAQARVARYARRLGGKLLDFEPAVRIVRHLEGGYLATWDKGDGGTLTLNHGRLGDNWWPVRGMTDEVVALLIHEFGHAGPNGTTISNHLSDEYHEALCRLGARMRALQYLEWE